MAEPVKVLMVCYFFPPILTSGTSRSLRFATDLKKSGHEPVVLTVKNSKDTWVKSDGSATPEDVKIVRSLEFNLNGLIRFAFGVINKPFKLAGLPLSRNHLLDYLCIPDPQIAWRAIWPGVQEAKEVDLIYVSCAPFSAAIKSAIVKILSGKPLILDFRDPWSINQYRYTPKLRKPLEKFIESLVLKKADALILNTPGAVELYLEHFNGLESKIFHIPNGPDQVQPAEQKRREGPFRIVHTGSFYGSRSPINLLQALTELNELDIELIHAGTESEELQEFSDKLNIIDKGMLSKNEALALCRDADLLYLRQGHENIDGRYVAIGAKTFDYLSTGLPILAECPQGDNTDIVQKYSNKYWIIDEQKDVEGIKKAISEAYADKDNRNTSIKATFEKDFSRKKLLDQLEKVFEHVLEDADQENVVPHSV